MMQVLGFVDCLRAPIKGGLQEKPKENHNSWDSLRHSCALSSSSFCLIVFWRGGWRFPKKDTPQLPKNDTPKLPKLRTCCAAVLRHHSRSHKARATGGACDRLGRWTLKWENHPSSGKANPALKWSAKGPCKELRKRPTLFLAGTAPELTFIYPGIDYGSADKEASRVALCVLVCTTGRSRRKVRTRIFEGMGSLTPGERGDPFPNPLEGSLQYYNPAPMCTVVC